MMALHKMNGLDFASFQRRNTICRFIVEQSANANGKTPYRFDTDNFNITKAFSRVIYIVPVY